MHNFEQVRSHLVASGYRITMQEPYVACVELSLEGGKRHQAIFLSELQDDDDRAYLRASTVIAPTTGIDGKRALAFNWESRVGYLAIGELDARINGETAGRPGGASSPEFTGLHRIELALFGRGSIADAKAYVPRLAADVRTLLAKFGLAGDHVSRPVASLSPGERTRAALALLQARGVNLLVLDEPTNHLDLPAIEQLEQALESFEGTVLLVTHDRRMLDTVRLTRRWHVEDGQVTEVTPDRAGVARTPRSLVPAEDHPGHPQVDRGEPQELERHVATHPQRAVGRQGGGGNRLGGAVHRLILPLGLRGHSGMRNQSGRALAL